MGTAASQQPQPEITPTNNAPVAMVNTFRPYTSESALRYQIQAPPPYIVYPSPPPPPHYTPYSQERIISPSVPRRMDRLTSAPPGEIQNARYQPAPQSHAQPGHTDSERSSMWGQLSGNISTSGESELPPNTPRDSDIEDSVSQGSQRSQLLESYGEQDFDLKELTWPMEQIMPMGQVISPGHNNAAEILLTERDVRESEAFITEMAEKRAMFESLQSELLRLLLLDKRTDATDAENCTQILTSICQLHHVLYGGSEDELGIEFIPAENDQEDAFILEQIDTLTRRHKQELISSDRDCAIKLLEYRGPRMEPQKLDSILEEHIKLRSYMRTKQTKDQIKAYQQIESQIRSDPTLCQASMKRPNHAVFSSPMNQVSSKKKEHPILGRLPPINLGKTRGRTVLHGGTSAVAPQPAPRLADNPMIKPRPYNPTASTDSDSDEEPEFQREASKMKPNFIASQIKPHSQSNTEPYQTRTGYSYPEVGQVRQKAEYNQSPVGAVHSQAAADPVHSQATVAPVLSQAAGHAGFQVITADPRYIASVGYQPQPVPVSQSERDKSTSKDRGQPSPRQMPNHGLEAEVGQFSTDKSLVSPNEALAQFASRQQKQMEPAQSETGSEPDDEDLLNAYKKTLGHQEEDDSDESLSELGPESLGAKGQEVEEEEEVVEDEDEIGEEQLATSMKLTDSTADALWENREKMNPSVFSAIMLLWKEKQHNIVAHKSSEKISGRAIWRKAKERLLDSALRNTTASDSEGEFDSRSSNSDSTTQSESIQATSSTTCTSVQTSMRGHSIGAQTDSYTVDVETLVDEYLQDDTETKKIKKMDKRLVEQLNEGHLDEEDIANLLNKNRNAVNKLRQQREAERLKALGLLEERKKRGKDREEFDEETQEQLDQVEKKLENKLIKYRSQLSGKDLKSLLSDARERQQEILRQRNLNRIRQNEMMRQRLIEKRNAQKAKEDEEKEPPKDKIEEMNDQFFQLLLQQLCNRELTEKEFKALIQKHLQNIESADPACQTAQTRHAKIQERLGSANKNKTTQEIREEELRRAQSIVKRSQEKHKVIQDIRQRERENAMSKLKQKRKHKKQVG